MCLGIPGQIVDIVDDENSIAKVDVNGVKRNVSVALVRPDGYIAYSTDHSGDSALKHVRSLLQKQVSQPARTRTAI